MRRLLSLMFLLLASCGSGNFVYAQSPASTPVQKALPARATPEDLQKQVHDLQVQLAQKQVELASLHKRVFYLQQLLDQKAANDADQELAEAQDKLDQLNKPPQKK